MMLMGTKDNGKKRILGLDPGLRRTGWGVIDCEGSNLKHIGNGTIKSSEKLEFVGRLVELHRGIVQVVNRFKPNLAASEETFVNKNAVSTLKLGIARGAVLIAPALDEIPVTEYAPNRIKKSIVGRGHATKEQIQVMIKRLLPGAEIDSPDAADALAVAICHANFSQTNSGLYGEEKKMRAMKGKNDTNRMHELIDLALLKEKMR